MRDNPSFDLADQLAPVRPSATAWPSQAVLKDSCWCGTVQLLHCGWNFLHMHIRFDGACDPFAWCGGICQYSCACLAQSDCTAVALQSPCIANPVNSRRSLQASPEPANSWLEAAVVGQVIAARGTSPTGSLWTANTRRRLCSLLSFATASCHSILAQLCHQVHVCKVDQVTELM